MTDLDLARTTMIRDHVRQALFELQDARRLLSYQEQTDENLAILEGCIEAQVRLERIEQVLRQIKTPVRQAHGLPS